MQLDIDHNANDLRIKQTDDDLVITYKLYRKKLQAFLKSPNTKFSTEKILKSISQSLLHEYALVVSKMNRHDETLRIYCHSLADLESAEDYCHRLYEQGVAGVYMSLILTLISPPERSVLMQEGGGDNLQPGSPISGAAGSNSKLLHIGISIAENNYDRIDSSEFLQAIPKTTPVAMLTKYLNLVIERSNVKKRNLQIVHQLLRLREVSIRTEEV